MSRRIFVIRHGNTFASSADARRVGAGTDIPLVDSGMAQAQRLASYFAALSLGTVRLYSGPLQRARQTAAPIAAALDHPVDAILPWLDEIDHGPDEGQPEAAVVSRLGEAAIAAWDRDGIVPDRWTVDAPARITAWRAWFAAEGEGTGLLIISNGAARFALLALGLAHGQLKLRTGAFGELVVDALSGSGRAGSSRMLNSIGHYCFRETIISGSRNGRCWMETCRSPVRSQVAVLSQI